MHINEADTDLPALRLMQLISPTLPTGGFTYSQGLEWVVENNIVSSEGQVFNWLKGLLQSSLQNLDLPVFFRLYHSMQNDDAKAVCEWADYLLACRETSELRQEEINRARALTTLLTDLGLPMPVDCLSALARTQLAGFALAAVHWQISQRRAAVGYCWSWIENQVAAAVKLVPLGQTAGQRLQMQLSEYVPVVVTAAMQVTDDQTGASSPMMAMASSLHETQYTRLFRS